MLRKETTREEVIEQARASAVKLGCDPDLLALMAIRIWEAAMETAATKVAREIHEYKTENLPTMDRLMVPVRALASQHSGSREYREIASHLINMCNEVRGIAPSYLESVLKEIERAK